MFIEETLFDTVPGRLFLEHAEWQWSMIATPLAEFVETLTATDLILDAASAVGRYLYSDDPAAVMRVDMTTLRYLTLESALRELVGRVRTSAAPQVHQGRLTELRNPLVRNRTGFNSLPDGAFWTSTPLDDGSSAWGECGENLRRGDPVVEVHYDEDRARIAVIDSAADWVALISPDAVRVGHTLHPNWPAIAERYDAVHVSTAGLLLAYPRLSLTPFESADGSGHRHNESGPYVGVGHWSAVSTAWLRVPPGVRLAPIAAESGT